MPSPLLSELEPYGARESDLVDFSTGTANCVPYLDMVQSDTPRSVPDGVVEHLGSPLAYIADNTLSRRRKNLPALLRTATLRSDAPYLAVIEPGQLQIYRTSYYSARFDKPGHSQVSSIPHGSRAAFTAFQKLNLALAEDDRPELDLQKLLFDLMATAIDALIGDGIDRDVAISLAGRALFARFLIDRSIIDQEHLAQVCPPADRVENLFADRAHALATCAWLDKTFNGDFLPLKGPRQETETETLGGVNFDPLANILHRSPGGQQIIDWGDLDFGHIPVGLLSQIYEKQADFWDPEGRRKRSIFYTPYKLAGLMVRDVFTNIRENGPCMPHEAKILDPAAGGGVFLVSAFQQLVVEWWRHHGRAPRTPELREILYNQIVGLEINEAAVRLAALSLYLKSIELDLDPHPPEKLRFEPLRPKVLRLLRGTSGSLGREVGSTWNNRFDAVIGNPPWTSVTSGDASLDFDEIEESTQAVAKDRMGDIAESIRIPDRVPDLPFLWRSMGWAKKNGWLALILHARLLFKTSRNGFKARSLLFSHLQVTGILNGAELRMTPVWPGMTAPFCVVIARNSIPADNDVAFYLNPFFEGRVNRQGRFRLDTANSFPVSLSAIRDRKFILKALFKGTALDVALLEKIYSHKWPTIGEMFSSGIGYKIGGKGSEPAGFLRSLRVLTATQAVETNLDECELPCFELEQVHRRRKRSIYKAPLVLRRKAVGISQEGRALYSSKDIAFSESFYGYSTSALPKAELHAKYLLLLFHSRLLLWYALLTSGQFGVERDTLLKLDIDTMPLPPLNSLSGQLQILIEREASRLLGGDPDWAEINRVIEAAFGLALPESQVVEDTTLVSLPYVSSQRMAEKIPDEDDVAAFLEVLGAELSKFGALAGVEIVTDLLLWSDEVPWIGFAIRATGQVLSEITSRPFEVLADAFALADREGASRLLVRDRSAVCVFILSKYRYWTPSRARLLALELIEDPRWGF